MIGRLCGTLLLKQPPYLLVEVQGIAYEIEAPMTTFYKLPETNFEVTLFTHLVVRADAHRLFGFASYDERLLFRHLIKVNGIGAKMALTILSGMETHHFIHCIRNEDTDSLVRLPGLGKKTAERLIVEMRDRLEDWETVTPSDQTKEQQIKSGNRSDEAISALVALGYKSQEASRLVSAVAQDDLNSEQIIREALKASLKK